MDPSTTQTQTTGVGDNQPGLMTIPPEICLLIFDHYLDTVPKAAFMPVDATAPFNESLALDGERPYSVRSTCPLLASCKQLRKEYLGPLRTSVMNGSIPQVSVHVFNFDFSPVTSQPVANIAQLRKENSTLALCTIRIKFTIRRNLTRSFYRSDLRTWFAWRANEDVGRKMKCQYVLRNLYTDTNGMEELRQFLIPPSIFATDQADVCRIMNTMRNRYFKVYEKLRDDEI